MPGLEARPLARGEDEASEDASSAPEARQGGARSGPRRAPGWTALLYRVAVPLAAAAAATAAAAAVAALGGAAGRRRSELSERAAITATEDLFAAQVAEQQRRMVEMLGETAHAETPEEVAAILRRLEEAAAPGDLLGEHMEVASNPTRLTEHIQSGNSTGVDHVLDAATHVAEATNTTYSDKPNSVGNCVISSVMAAITAGNAALGIKSAVNFCNREDKAPGLCTGSIVSVVTSFSWMGSFLSGSVHNCMTTPDLGADCAEDVLAVVGGLGTAVLSAAQIHYTCPPISHQMFDEGKFNGYDYNSTETFACIVDSLFAANSLASAIQSIFNAVKDCSTDAIRPDGLSPSGITIASKHLCAADALEVAAAFQFLGSFLAQAVDNCAPTFNTDALCAANIIQLMAALTAMAGRAVRMADDCNPANLNDTRFNPAAPR